MNNETKRYTKALIGFIASYFIIATALVYLLISQIISLPFHEIHTPGDAWHAVLRYLPIVGITISMFIWLIYSRISVKEPFLWKRFSKLFFVGLAISLYYSFNLLVIKKQSLEGLPFWLPLIVLCLLNSFSEEILFRHVMLGLLTKIFKLPGIPNLIQSLFYAIPHLIYGSFKFAGYAMCYGFLLGLIKNQNGGSIVPCIICHFVIDFGAIGTAVL